MFIWLFWPCGGGQSLISAFHYHHFIEIPWDLEHYTYVSGLCNGNLCSWLKLLVFSCLSALSNISLSLIMLTMPHYLVCNCLKPILVIFYN